MNIERALDISLKLDEICDQIEYFNKVGYYDLSHEYFLEREKVKLLQMSFDYEYGEGKIVVIGVENETTREVK